MNKKFAFTATIKASKRMARWAPQRYKCKDCGQQFRGVKRLEIDLLSDDTVFGCQSVNRLTAKHGVSSSTIRRKLDSLRSTRIVSSDKRVVVLMNTYHLLGLEIWRGGFQRCSDIEDLMAQIHLSPRDTCRLPRGC